MRTSRPLFVSACIASAALLGASSADATVFRSKTDKLEITVGPPDAHVCVVQPSELRDAAGCDGLDMAALARMSLPEGVIGAAFVRNDDYAYLALVTEVMRSSVVSMDDAREYFAGTGKGRAREVARYGAVVNAKPAEVALKSFGKVQAVTALFDGAPPGASTPAALVGGRQRAYLVSGKSSAVAISFTSFFGDAARVDADAEAAMRTLSFAEARRPFESRAYQFGYHLGAVIFWIGFAAIGIAATIFLAKSGGKKKSRHDPYRMPAATYRSGSPRSE